MYYLKINNLIWNFPNNIARINRLQYFLFLSVQLSVTHYCANKKLRKYPIYLCVSDAVSVRYERTSKIQFSPDKNSRFGFSGAQNANASYAPSARVV